jgi:hypothetical protein
MTTGLLLTIVAGVCQWFFNCPLKMATCCDMAHRTAVHFEGMLKWSFRHRMFVLNWSGFWAGCKKGTLRNFIPQNGWRIIDRPNWIVAFAGALVLSILFYGWGMSDG